MATRYLPNRLRSEPREARTRERGSRKGRVISFRDLLPFNLLCVYSVQLPTKYAVPRDIGTWGADPARGTLPSIFRGFRIFRGTADYART